MSNVDAAKSGDHRRALEQVRDTLATAIDLAVERGDGTVAQLAAQYRGVLAEIAGLDQAEPAGEVSDLDRIRARREGRDNTATDRPRATRRRKLGDG